MAPYKGSNPIPNRDNRSVDTGGPFDYDVNNKGVVKTIKNVNRMFINDNGDAIFFRDAKAIAVFPYGQYTNIIISTENK